MCGGAGGQGTRLHVEVLALADGLSEVLVAAEDGVLCVADAPRWNRPARNNLKPLDLRAQFAHTLQCQRPEWPLTRLSNLSADGSGCMMLHKRRVMFRHGLGGSIATYTATDMGGGMAGPHTV
jgi:hypothetical protein